MATDPIRSISDQEHDSELDLHAPEILQAMALLPPSKDVPYVTVSLDWRPDGTDPGRSSSPDPRPSERRSRNEDQSASRRPSRQQLERELAQAIEQHGPRGPIFDSLSADAERIADYLDNELDPSAQGVFLVSCSANDVFMPLALGLPIETSMAISATPSLMLLAKLVDDHPTYAVLLADQHDAYLSFFTQATREQSVELSSSDWPRNQKQGGWSQRRFQARAEERVEAFARGIAEETQLALDELGVDMLILAGDEIIMSALDAEFHQRVKDRVIGTLRLDIGISDQDLLASTLPLAQEAERQRESDAVQALCNELGAGGKAAAGVSDSLKAVQRGQVETLVMTDDFIGNGWADFDLPLYGVGMVPTEHPAGADPAALVPVSLQGELIRLTLLAGGDVQIVSTESPINAEDLDHIPESGMSPPRASAAADLDKLGGIGVLLRFSIDQITDRGPI